MNLVAVLPENTHQEKLREEESQFLEYPFKGSYSNHDQSVEVKHHEISDALNINRLLQCTGIVIA